MKIGVIGKNSGRITMIEEYVYDGRQMTMEMMVQSSHQKRIERKGKEMIIDIYQMSVSEMKEKGYEEVTDLFLKSCDGYIFCYQVDDRSTLEDVETIVDMMYAVRETSRNGQIPFILCGLKGNPQFSQPQIISTEEGQEIANELGVSFYEIFKYNKEEVTNVFNTLIHQIDNRNSQSSSSCVLF